MSNESVNTFDWRGTLARLADTIKTYIGQVLITSAGVSMTASFASHADILPPVIAWLMAIGFEVQWLRGLAQAGQTRSRWVGAMVAAGFSSIVIFGVLACLIGYKLLPERPEPLVGLLLAL